MGQGVKKELVICWLEIQILMTASINQSLLLKYVYFQFENVALFLLVKEVLI